ncbi:helix-turn-helix domain-containing protein [Clostridium sp. MCC353]|uniref:helix-turn-helix domain-containing protein n=1 Tax=Clostridium sp. MCC353 TaxID=2592646 RepID=UPI001C00FE36|nr:helix-turn-helix domain-containing protein [Clostridium sp. MCC353]MBT9777058.1 helix-turn-helix domain-containing protein [Clostridium sp. MCC353]
MKKRFVKKKMLYSLLIPYLLAGIFVTAFFGYKYNASVKEIKNSYFEENEAVLGKLNRELDYLISDIENLIVEVELDNQLLKPLAISEGKRSGSENYSIAMALIRLRNIKKYNHLIEDLLLYYRKGNFFLNTLSIRDEQGIYKDYSSNQTVGFEQWKGALTPVYPQGRLVTAGESIFYIVTVPFNEQIESCNVIVKIDSDGFSELMNDYNLVNENAVYLFDSHMTQVASNIIGKALPLSEDDVKAAFQNAVSGSRLELNRTTYHISGAQSDKTGLNYLLLTKAEILDTQIRYITLLYTGGGILIALLLFLGIYGVAVNYRHIQSIIERLMKNNEKECEKNYSEFDYINNALNALEEKMQGQEREVLDNCIRKAIYGLLDEEDSGCVHLFKHQEQLCYGQSMIAVFENCSEHEREAKEVNLDLFIIDNVFRDIFEQNVQSWGVAVYRWEILVLNWCNEGGIEAEYVQNGLRSARKFLEERLELPYTVGVSEPVCGIKEFPRGYREAVEAVEEKQVLGEKQVICYGKIKDGGHHFEYTGEMEKRFKNYIRLGDYEKAREQIENIYNEAFRQNPISPEGGKLLLLNLIKTVNEISKERNDPRQVDAAAVLKKKYTAHSMKNEILEVVEYLCAQSMETVDSAETRIDQIRQYVAAHYENVDLNVSMIAEAFHLNPSYLSRFFKEETGENLLNYINHFRVEKVKELLRCTDETITVTAGKTGFLNAAALSRTFKKMEGITPGQYKAIHQAEGKL